MEEKHVLIRADGNAAVAMGHVMRCLTIADALTELHMKVTFVMAGDDAASLIERRGYESQILHSNYTETEAEVPSFKKLIIELEPDFILVDTYYATPDYFEAIKGMCPIGMIDDFGDRAFPVDAVFNFQCYGTETDYSLLYSKAGVPKPSLILAGAGYLPLRSEYRSAAKSRRSKEVRDVLIMTGGGDPLSVAEAIANELLITHQQDQKSDIHYHFLCGQFSKSLPALKRLTEENPHLLLHTWVDAFWDFIKDFDLAITASGGTIYELCTVELPCVTYTFARNQWELCRWLTEHAGIPTVGDVVLRTGEAGAIASEDDRVDPAKVRELVGLCHELEHDADRRDAIRNGMQTVTDGKGATRLAMELLSFLEKKA